MECLVNATLGKLDTNIECTLNHQIKYIMTKEDKTYEIKSTKHPIQLINNFSYPCQWIFLHIQD